MNYNRRRNAGHATNKVMSVSTLLKDEVEICVSALPSSELFM